MKANKILSNTFFKLLGLFIFILLLTDRDQTRMRKENKFLKTPPYTAVEEINTKEIPEGYAEVVTDTILTNDFVVKVKYYSTSDKVYHIENKRNSINKTVYKEFHSDVFVYYKKQLVLKRGVGKELFKEPNNKFWDKCIMRAIQINEIASRNNNVVFDISFFNPSEDKYRDYKLIVDQQGHYYIQNTTT